MSRLPLGGTARRRAKDTDTADQMPLSTESLDGHRTPAGLAAARRAALASFFIHHTVPSRPRTAEMNVSRSSHLASGLEASRAVRVSSVISKRSLSGRSTVIRW